MLSASTPIFAAQHDGSSGGLERDGDDLARRLTRFPSAVTELHD